jgi:hypothetical protein
MRTIGGPVREELQAEAEQWLRHSVGCLVGRAEIRRERFLLAVADGPQDLEEVRREYGAALCTGDVASCLVLLEPENESLKQLPIGNLVEYLDERYFRSGTAGTAGTAGASGAAATSELAGNSGNSGNYSLTYRLHCPVTEVEVEYSDFDQVAFYPQAMDETDPLYDPSMDAPWICMNITSDVYGFSMLTADVHRRRSGTGPVGPVGELSQEQRAELYATATKMFQRLAEGTIEKYARATNPEVLCPIHLAEGRRYYVAPHDESAFIETVKRPFRAEMPVVYVQRIIDQWEEFFSHKAIPDMSQIFNAPVPVSL